MFADRIDAGRQLAGLLTHLVGPDTTVLALPRGGVPVAAEVARALGAPLDVIVVRKLGVPVQPELAMGAIGENGVRFIDQTLVERLQISAAEITAVEERERRELDRRVAQFRQGRPPVELGGKQAVLIDDGIATGSTARVACQIVREAGARRVVLAVPVAPPDWEGRLADVADELVAVATPRRFRSIGSFYRDFRQVTTAEAAALLANPGL